MRHVRWLDGPAGEGEAAQLWRPPDGSRTGRGRHTPGASALNPAGTPSREFPPARIPKRLRGSLSCPRETAPDAARRLAGVEGRGRTIGGRSVTMRDSPVWAMASSATIAGRGRADRPRPGRIWRERWSARPASIDPTCETALDAARR